MASIWIGVGTEWKKLFKGIIIKSDWKFIRKIEAMSGSSCKKCIWEQSTM